MPPPTRVAETEMSTVRTLFGGRACEELVAELANCFVCADLGITPAFENNADYLKHWTQYLQEGEPAIFTAASEASHVARYLQALDIPLAVSALTSRLHPISSSPMI